MIEYSAQVNNMCPITKGPKHGPAPIPEEGQWVKAYKIEDISGYTHGVGWCAPQQGTCKLSLNIKNGGPQVTSVPGISLKLHRVSDWYHKGSFLNAHNFCIHRYHCRKTNVCRKIILCNIKCTSCPTCNQTCPDFVKEQCNRLDKAPYVCNGCPKAINHCSIAHKYRYDAVFADRKYKERLSSSRSGINKIGRASCRERV